MTKVQELAWRSCKFRKIVDATILEFFEALELARQSGQKALAE